MEQKEQEGEIGAEDKNDVKIVLEDASILKPSNQQQLDELPQIKKKSGNSKEESATRSRKVVPPWYLFRFANWLDIIMILVGTLAAMLAGVGLPGHILMFGEIIDNFIAFDLASEIREQNSISNSSQAMMFVANRPMSGSNQTAYFCNFTDDPDSTSNLIEYVTADDLGDLLQQEIALFSYYYLALSFGLLLVSFIGNAFWNLSSFRQTKRMRLAFYRAILKQNIGWFDVNPSGELSTRLSDDIEKIQAGIGEKIALFLQYLSTFITGFIIAFVRNWKLTLVIAVILPLLATIAAIIGKIVASFTVREQNAYAAAGGVAEEVLSSIRTVVAFGGETVEADRYKNQLSKAKKEGYKKGVAVAIVSGLLFFVIFSGYALGFWYGGVLIADCELRPGLVVTVFFSVIIASFSLGNALPELEAFATAIGSATGVFAVIDRESEIDVTKDEGIIPESIEGNIEFNDVIFNYPARPNVRVLHGLDLTVRVGQTVALVGASGCGKSTVVQLIQRFYDPISGLVKLDGRDLSSLNLKWLRSNIGVVSQEPVLFDTTITENIRHGKEDATMEEIEAAAKNANAHNFISQLPDGYNTLVGEKGTQLSGGQKQRVAIARALVRDPKILLLDEATSALDTESERVVQEALDRAREGRTTIVIAHRLSTIQTADLIVGIENGRVVEFGTHEQLMGNEGLYYELVNAQTFIDEEEQSSDSLSGFKIALQRSTSRQRTTSTSSNDAFQRQVSTQSTSSNPFYAVNDISRSIEDIAGAVQASPFISRKLNNELSLSNRKKLVIEPSSPERTISDNKVVQFDVEAQEVEATGKRRGSWFKRRRSSKTEDEEEEPLIEVGTKELLKLNSPDWFLVIPGIISAALVGISFPLIAILFSGVLDLFSSNDRDELLDGVSEYAIWFILLAIGAAFINFMAAACLSLAGERLTARLRDKTFRAMLRQEMSWFDKKANSTGTLTSRLATDASEVKGATGIRLGTVLQTLFGFLAALIIAFEASWLLSLVLFVCFPALAGVGYLQIYIQKGRTVRNKKLFAESGKTAVESIENIRTVVSLGIEDKLHTQYGEQIKPPFKSNIKSGLVTAVIFGIAQASIFFIYGGGFSMGAFIVASDPSEVYYADYDNIFRVFAAVVFTALSLGRASSFAPDAQKAQISASRILTLLSREPLIDSYSKDGILPDSTTGSIAVKDAQFSYPTRQYVPVLKGLSVSVQSGQTLALVGPSGCGKSTVVSLIERFYDVLGGSVELDSNDLRDINIQWLRRQIGIVSQEPVLFDKSIAENIKYGANYREVSDEEVIEAAKAANIHSFIETLPEGYETNVGSKGTQLSGGQKQRVAIARALVRDPKILLLDEATSALDTESERIVQEALDRAREGRTAIVIAHRLSTIYNSDCIAVIHNGQVIEQGTHSELMAQEGAYYLLNTVQKKND